MKATPLAFHRRSALQRLLLLLLLVPLTQFVCVDEAFAQAGRTPGSLRGVVTDGDFGRPLSGVEITILQLDRGGVTDARGNYFLPELPPGSYTVFFKKPGFVQNVKSGVIVNPGAVTELDVLMRGDFTDLEEFVVQDALGGGAGTEAALLALRFESPALLDSISSELLSRAGVSDAAGALNLVSGATVQDGRFAVIRGLPNRFVSSQLNGVRLPTTVDDQRAVELDQFPSTVIESIQVSKTFTPNQQGDATGGAVDVRLKAIPESTVRNVSVSFGSNSNINSNPFTLDNDFQTYADGGVGPWGVNEGNDPQTPGGPWTGSFDVTEEEAPIEFKIGTSWGGKRELQDGWRVGGLLTTFYERDVSGFDDGVDDRYTQVPGNPFLPEVVSGDDATNPEPPTPGLDQNLALLDVIQNREELQWGGLAAAGIENDLNEITLIGLFTRTVQSTATLALGTRGKEFVFPGYDPTDEDDPGNDFSNLGTAAYTRSETLDYTERDLYSIQLAGRHTLATRETELDTGLTFKRPEIDWVAAYSKATLDQPDQRSFSGLWRPVFNDASPAFPGVWLPLLPAANANFGNVNRIFRRTDEESLQTSVNVDIPFERDGGLEGVIRTGTFIDRLDRSFDQDTFSTATSLGTNFPGANFDEPWSAAFPGTANNVIFEDNVDVDYEGSIDITAFYTMLELPISDPLDLVLGVRFVDTDIAIVNDPEDEVFFLDPTGATGTPIELNPGDADALSQESNILPSIGFDWELNKKWTLRGAFSQTIARQTFQELSPIFQQEFLGGPIFIGNADLEQSEIDNFDLRLDYEPYKGGLISVSAFYKDITDPIEYIQRNTGISFTTPVNYPEGELFGAEIEIRQDLGEWSRDLQGFKTGGNLTVLQGEVTIPAFDVQTSINDLNIDRTKRDLTEAPEYLLNLFLTYDVEQTGTQAGLFYTIKGDTLVAGASTQSVFVPDVYLREFDNLNFTLSQQLADGVVMRLAARNLTNPVIREVYRDESIGDDVTRSARTRGIDFSLGLSFTF